MTTPNESIQEVYVCKLGHRSYQPGHCPQDASEVEPATSICEYCDYATHVPEKNGKCPNCEAPMKSLTGKA